MTKLQYNSLKTGSLYLSFMKDVCLVLEKNDDHFKVISFKNLVITNHKINLDYKGNKQTIFIC